MLYKYLFLVNKGNIFFLHQMMLLLVMVKHSPIFNIFIPIFYIVKYKHLLKYNQLKELKLVIEVIILRQEN